MDRHVSGIVFDRARFRQMFKINFLENLAPYANIFISKLDLFLHKVSLRILPHFYTFLLIWINLVYLTIYVKLLTLLNVKFNNGVLVSVFSSKTQLLFDKFKKINIIHLKNFQTSYNYLKEYFQQCILFFLSM